MTIIKSELIDAQFECTTAASETPGVVGRPIWDSSTKSVCVDNGTEFCGLVSNKNLVIRDDESLQYTNPKDPDDTIIIPKFTLALPAPGAFTEKLYFSNGPITTMLLDVNCFECINDGCDLQLTVGPCANKPWQVGSIGITCTDFEFFENQQQSDDWSSNEILRATAIRTRGLDGTGFVIGTNDQVPSDKPNSTLFLCNKAGFYDIDIVIGIEFNNNIGNPSPLQFAGDREEWTGEVHSNLIPVQGKGTFVLDRDRVNFSFNNGSQYNQFASYTMSIRYEFAVGDWIALGINRFDLQRVNFGGNTVDSIQSRPRYCKFSAWRFATNA